MNKAIEGFHLRFIPHQPELNSDGFSLVEFLVSVVILMVLSAGIFTMLTDAQGTTGYQTEVLSTMENTRIAMSVLGRYIVQAGNNPKEAAFTPVTITSATQVQLCSDLTGSAGGSQGDPDGDILDSDENITIRYNSNARTIELVDGSGTSRNLARNISAFSMTYLDATGASTSNGANVRSVRIAISGASNVANPRTQKTFGQTLTGVFTLPNRG
jgi:Tfp pilus assembly protein PilW